MKRVISITTLCLSAACGVMPQGPDRVANVPVQGASTNPGTPTPSSDTNTFSQAPTGTPLVPARNNALQQGFQLQAVLEPHLCVDSGNSNVPTMQPCSQAASQRWSYRNGALAQGSMCLGPFDDTSVGATVNITMEPCDPNTNTIQWEYIYGVFYVTDITHNTCLAANPTVGSPLSAVPSCQSPPAQARFLLSGSFTIEAAANPNKCWTVEGTPAAGSPVVLDDCTMTSGQLWSSLVQVFVMQDFCVAISTSPSLDNMPLALQPCGGDYYGDWRLFSPGHIQLSNGYDVAYADLSKGSTITTQVGSNTAAPINDPNRLWFIGP